MRKFFIILFSFVFLLNTSAITLEELKENKNTTHQKIKDNPVNIKILTTIFKVIVYAEFEQEQALNELEQIGIPIVKNGKVVIDDDAINKLILAYQKEVCDINFISVKSK